MPRSPSMNVISLRVEAVFTNPWSSVVRPVCFMNVEMSTLSCPAALRMIGNSAVPPG
jgi:hypothetical protein